MSYCDQIEQKKVPVKATGRGTTKISAIHALYHPLAKAQCSTMNSLWTILLYGSMGTCPNWRLLPADALCLPTSSWCQLSS